MTKTEFMILVSEYAEALADYINEGENPYQAHELLQRIEAAFDEIRAEGVRDERERCASLVKRIWKQSNHLAIVGEGLAVEILKGTDSGKT